MNASDETPLIRIRDLTRSYTVGGWPSSRRVPALAGVTLDIPEGRVTAVVGESGSGKTTLGLCLTRLTDADGGSILIGTQDALALRGAALRSFRRSIQLVFQDASSAMNPAFTIRQILEEPLRVQRWGTSAEMERRVTESQDAVGIPPSWNERLPAMLSGGQRQRVALARALVLRPAVLVLDEILRGLDLIAAAQILELLRRLRVSHSMTYVFITHDLTAVRDFADHIAVMKDGTIVEHGPVRTVLEAPVHAHTRALIDAQLDVAGGSWS